MSKYKIVKMRTGQSRNDAVYTLFRDFGGEFGALHSPKYYKTKKGATRAMNKRIKLNI